jgi:amidase
VETTEPDRLGAFCPGPRVSLPGADSGPLSGLAFAAKDNFDVAGFVSGAGNPDWLRTHKAARRTATAVEKLLAAGARLVGKTIMDELAFGSIGENRHYGTPLNPAAPGRVPGGSSSGSASAVAGGAVDFALGTDTGCSVRLPAALCGLYGIRPTHGRVSVDGVTPLSPSLDTVGWLARTPEVMRRVGEVLLAPHAATQRPRRVLVAEDAFELARDEVAKALEPWIEEVERRVGPAERVRIGEPGGRRAVGLLFLFVGAVLLHEAWACHGEWIESARPESQVLTRANLARGADATPEQIAEARREFEEMRGWIRERVPSGSILVLPTSTDVAPPCGAPEEMLGSFRFPTLSMLAVAGLGGLPQVNLPGATVDGLPVGFSLAGEPGADQWLLKIACELGEAPRGAA